MDRRVPLPARIETEGTVNNRLLSTVLIPDPTELLLLILLALQVQRVPTPGLNAMVFRGVISAV